MKITLMGLQLENDNKGCEALSYSFISILEDIARKSSTTIHYNAIIYSDEKKVQIPVCDSEIDCLKISVKKLSFWKNLWTIFKESDYIFDFTGGDSFSDIYGKKRFYMMSAIKMFALKSHTPLVLGPQTIGPFYTKGVRKLAAKIIKNSSAVYARDAISCEYAEKISKRKVVLTTDVAFSLPYVKTNKEDDGCIWVGFNPSGLLWEGGYNRSNQFGLKTDYREYCFSTLNALVRARKYKIFLIPHVGTQKREYQENDYNVCLELQQKFPDCVVVEGIKNPIDAKNIISQMDVLVGARMHATIAAFSANVATIPFAYSRKFQGLYNDLNYNYLIDAINISTDEAVSKTLEYIKTYKELKHTVETSMAVVEKKQNIFKDELLKMMKIVEN